MLRCGSGFVLAMLIVSTARASGLPWEVWESPSRFATIDAGDIVLERSSHCLDGCRYDRSNRGPEDPADNPYPLRWLYRDGDEVVVFDERGPGAITRLWLTTGFGVSTCIDPAIRVRFYIDGTPTPALDVALAALFDGSTPPFTTPLVADRSQASGGYSSYVPIAYAQSLRIALVGADNGGTNPCTGNDERLLWFQIQHHRVTPDTAVTSFAPGQDFPAWSAFLAHAGDDPWNGMLEPQVATSTLNPGSTIDLASQTGLGWLRGIRLRLARSAYADVDLRIALDDEVAADVPLADFFATAPGTTIPARGVLAGEGADGWLYAWIPMPFVESARVALAAGDGLDAPVEIESALAFDDAPVDATVGRYAATLVDTCVSGRSFDIYAQRGAGKVVGISARYRANGVVDRGYLEGDERAYADDMTAPLWYGTGIEDFHDGGFYFDGGAYALALSGATEVDPDGSDVTAAYRWMPSDALVFSSALRFGIEAGYSPIAPVPMCARTVVHAYMQARAAVVSYDRFEVGDASATAHGYAPPAGANCGPLSATFEDEPPTSRSATVCRWSSGSSRFSFRPIALAPPLRLRRIFDAGEGMPGEVAGTPAADVIVNGVVAGHFPPAIANPARRWQQQEALLDAIAGDTLDIEIVPEFSATASSFSESAWELRGGWVDPIFVDGFDSAAGNAAN